MALSGLEIYKLLPKTNCKDCNYPTCLAFAMKLAAKQAELKDCPHVSEESQIKLAAASAPPIRLVEIGNDDHKVSAGNEIVLFRHEKTFYHRPGIFIHIYDDMPQAEIEALVARVDAFRIDYVGIDLVVDGFALEAKSGDADKFHQLVSSVCAGSQKALILISPDVDVLRRGYEACPDQKPLLHGANENNWQAMAELAIELKAPLGVQAGSLETLSDLSTKLLDTGLEDLVLDPCVNNFQDSIAMLTAIRRMALKQNFKPLGFPVLTFPAAGGLDESLLAAQHVAKYAGMIVLDHFDPAVLYALLVLRQNIYTDPQKPIQVKPGIYEINSPDADAPMLVTTNFSITYFSVANEIESSGKPAWLIVTDSEGMSVLTAWAAGKFDSERIAKDMKIFNAAEKVSHKKVVIPGHVAVISGELEEELPDWKIMVGPREAVDISGYIKTMWAS